MYRSRAQSLRRRKVFGGTIDLELIDCDKGYDLQKKKTQQQQQLNCCIHIICTLRT